MQHTPHRGDSSMSFLEMRLRLATGLPLTDDLRLQLGGGR
jgi:hypothetical protein